MGQRSEAADKIYIDLHGIQNRGVIATNENISHVSLSNLHDLLINCSILHCLSLS